MSSVFSWMGAELGELLYPIERAALVPGALHDLLARLGIPIESHTPALTTSIAALNELKNAITVVAAEGEPSLSDIVKLLHTAGNAFDALRQIDGAGGPLARWSGVTRELIDHIVTNWLAAHHPVAHTVLVLLTLIELESDQPVPLVQMQGTEVVRYSYRIDRLHLDRIGSLLRDPNAVFRSAYLTPLQTSADADKMADALFSKLERLFRAFGLSCRYGVNAGDETLLGESAPYANRALIVYFNDPLVSDLAPESGVVLSLSPADRGDLGLVVHPFGTLTTRGVIGPFSIDASLTAGIDAFAVGRHGFTIASSTSAEVAASVTATLGLFENDSEFIIGSPTGTRLEVGGVSFGAEANLSAAAQRFALSADVHSSTLVVSGGDGDGFLADVLPPDGIRADFAIGATWDSETGLRFRGSANLEATLAVGLALGPVTLSAVHLGLRANPDGSVETEVSASAGFALGPVKANIQRMGLSTRTTFPQNGGNLGAANLSLGFKAPSGVGLSLDANGVLTGGGFLQYDASTATYGGVMQLALQDSITLTGFGLIATKMPDGKPGYSLLIFITAEGFKPIPLGFGFVLQSLGGMLGVNRTFDVDVLRAGLKSNTLATLLFPRDPVANAPVLLQTLASAFPVRRGSILVGLLAKITWFTPTLVTLDLALILEIGARTRLLLLGRVSALLPTAENDLIRLQLDTIGVLDFDAGSLEADAVLVDSRLVHRFPVTGSAALRARWGDSPNFVLAVGGLNPRFAAPAGFPVLDRVAIALTTGKNPRLVCDAYFAITANTVQFGARASLFAEAAGFSVTGDIGFDALITLVPPHFIVDFHAAMQLKRGSTNLFKVTVDGTLEGPLPLRIAAKAKFEILWFDFTVRFTFTLASGSTAMSVPAVALETEVLKALADPTNWRTQLTPGLGHGVGLRALPTGAVGQVLDPLGQLAVQQAVAPLNMTRDIETLGGVPVTGRRQLALTGQLNSQLGNAVQAAFAPARYFVLRDDDALVAPSFETHDAGMVLGDDTVTYSVPAIVSSPLNYEPVIMAALPIVGAPGTPVAPSAASAAPTSWTLPVTSLQAQRPSGAAARAPVRRVGRARFRHEPAVPPAMIKPPKWAIVKVANGAVAPMPADVSTWSGYHAELNKLNRGGAHWVLVPAHEL